MIMTRLIFDVFDVASERRIDDDDDDDDVTKAS